MARRRMGARIYGLRPRSGAGRTPAMWTTCWKPHTGPAAFCLGPDSTAHDIITAHSSRAGKACSRRGRSSQFRASGRGDGGGSRRDGVSGAFRGHAPFLRNLRDACALNGTIYRMDAVFCKQARQAPAAGRSAACPISPRESLQLAKRTSLPFLHRDLSWPFYNTSGVHPPRRESRLSSQPL